MADFGKLNFSVSLKPTGAFPINANQYFESLEDAQAAAATAEEVGSTNTIYHYGMKLLVAQNGVDTWYTIQRDGTLIAEEQFQTALQQYVIENAVSNDEIVSLLD